MADNKKTNWLTTEQKPKKPIQKRQGEVREKRSYSGRISESSVEKFRKGGTIHESQCPSRKKSQEANKCYSQGPCKPHE